MNQWDGINVTAACAQIKGVLLAILTKTVESNRPKVR